MPWHLGMGAKSGRAGGARISERVRSTHELGSHWGTGRLGGWLGAGDGSGGGGDAGGVGDDGEVQENRTWTAGHRGRPTRQERTARRAGG